MDTERHADEIEQRGFSYLEQERWPEARESFEEMMRLPITPLRQVKVLRNIMGVYEKEGLREDAIRTGREALNIIESHDLWHKGVEGAMLRGSINGHLARLTGAPTAVALGLPVAVSSAYISGAAWGALLGSKIEVNSINIYGPVLTDLRYGGAAIGAILGLVLFTGLLRKGGAGISAMVGIGNLALLLYILTANDFKLGALVLAFILILPFMLFLFVRNRG